ncbi:MAG: adenylate kinase family protein [Methanoregulaceae archaeon]|nr:adenylate kinase family protein [Methanoregulaceae archaeon]
MMVGITGTPGTGKSSVADELAARGCRVVRLIETIGPYVIGKDPVRGVDMVDEERWSGEFIPVDGFVEGQLAHLLPCDRVVVLRCRPDVLADRLRTRGYPEEKVRENVEAEALDVILIETLEEHPPQTILELETTTEVPSRIADLVLLFSKGETPPSHGMIDWSGFLGAA